MILQSALALRSNRRLMAAFYLAPVEIELHTHECRRVNNIMKPALIVLP